MERLRSAVNSAHLHRRPRKIRRTGRHTTPSQVQNVADRAGKAAPAMAITGVLIAAPHAHAGHAAVRDTTTIVKQIHTDAVVTQTHTDAVITRDQPAERTYTVRRGDSLSSIAAHFYGRAADWSELYQVNKAEIHNPNLIYQGEVLDVPEHLSAGTTTYTPKHAKSTVLTSSTTLSGTLSCGGLEELWEEAGGSHAEAFMAAEIAMAESSGRQFATGSVGERGYWQINPNHGSLSTYDPLGNAKAAVILSDDGSNWTPWTTFTSGAYHGRC
jgi:LysM repeat protein